MVHIFRSRYAKYGIIEVVLYVNVLAKAIFVYDGVEPVATKKMFKKDSKEIFSNGY